MLTTFIIIIIIAQFFLLFYIKHVDIRLNEIEKNQFNILKKYDLENEI